MRTGPTVVTLTVSDSIFADPTGADVDASIHAYANLLEREMEHQFDDWLLDITIRETRSTGLHSIAIYPGPDITPEQERDLHDDIDHLMGRILSGDYGDWTVPLTPDNIPEENMAQKESALILELCREADQLGIEPLGDQSEEQIIEGFRSNYPDDVIRAAAEGDVAAIVELRRGCGLPIVR